MPFKPNEKQLKKLAALSSTYAFANRGTTYERGPDGTMEAQPMPKGEGKVCCRLVDLNTNESWHRSFGATEDLALTEALKTAMPEDRPQSVADILAENRAMREKLAKYEGESANAPASTKDPSDMSNGELLVYLKGKGIEPPTGDRRKGEWKAAALALLEPADNPDEDDDDDPDE